MEFSNINYLAVLVSALASFGIGSLWYSPILFGNAWQKGVGLTNDELTAGGSAGMIKTFGGSLILMLIMILGLAMILSAQVGTVDMMVGLKTGLLVGVMFAATGMGINYLYQRKSLKLFIIDASYQIVYMGIAGLILGLWR
jgi:Protein of unknown function (DUF1761)